MRVLFAPDYRAGVPYQALLADALGKRGIKVSFLSENCRRLPLYRGSHKHSADIVHLHWPDRYFPERPGNWNLLPGGSYRFDYSLTTYHRPIVVTAHNLLPHNRAKERGVYRSTLYTMQRARAIFTHSCVARRQLYETFSVPSDHIHIIPFGDLSVTMGRPLPRDEARAVLKLPPDSKICLVFGSISPYKGSDELVGFWARNKLPYRLVIVGPIFSQPFANELCELARGDSMIDLRLLSTWLDEATLRLWLSAADCSIFNYREIFTSGAAPLARSYGLPILIPSRLVSVDLDEPHHLVFRFASLDSDFRAQLESALDTPRDFDAAREWREKTSWERVAEITASVYHSVLI